MLLATVEADFKKSDALPRFVLEKNVDGIIVAGKVPQNLIDRITVLQIPITFVDYEYTSKCCRVAQVNWSPLYCRQLKWVNSI